MMNIWSVCSFEWNILCTGPKRETFIGWAKKENVRYIVIVLPMINVKECPQFQTEANELEEEVGEEFVLLFTLYVI